MFSTSKGILLWAEYSDSGTPPGFHAALYDPATEKWKKLAEPPVVLTTEQNAWTGRELVFPGAALAYDLRRDAWHSITPPPVHVSEQTLVVAAPPNVVVVNAACELCSVFLMDSPGSALYDPANDRWTEIASPPEGSKYSGHRVVRSLDRGLGYAEPRRPSGRCRLSEPEGSWVYAVGSSPALTQRHRIARPWSPTPSSGCTGTTRSARSSGAGVGRRTWSRRPGSSLSAPGHLRRGQRSPGPRGSALVQCNRVDRLAPPRRGRGQVVRPSDSAGTHRDQHLGRARSLRDHHRGPTSGPPLTRFPPELASRSDLWGPRVTQVGRNVRLCLSGRTI